MSLPKALALDFCLKDYPRFFDCPRKFLQTAKTYRLRLVSCGKNLTLFEGVLARNAKW